MGIQEALIATVATMEAQKVPYRERVKLFKRQCMYSALKRHRGNVEAAADEMGITAATIYGIMREHATQKIMESGTL